MTTLREPRQAAGYDEVPREQEGELASLVRRWMIAGGRATVRGRSDTVLRLAPPPRSDDVPSQVSDDDLLEREEPTPSVPDRATVPAGLAPLPRRAAEDQQVSRTAVLVDARRIPAEAAVGLLTMVAERGAISVCRAYADWSSAAVADWAGRMRREGLHSFHHFADDDEQALVAMTIDALDVARDTAVDEMVLAGDLTSVLPLVHRLHAAGVRVVGVGVGMTPHEVRGACDEYLDCSALVGTTTAPAGRHRA